VNAIVDIFQDELKIASSEEDKKYVVELFERGVQVIPTRYLFFMFHIFTLCSRLSFTEFLFPFSTPLFV